MSNARVVLCPHCGSEGRLYTSDGGPYDTDCGPCPTCDGTGGAVIETIPVTLDDHNDNPEGLPHD